MKNSIFSIKPYKYEGTWVFDDERVGLVKEPFLMGIPEMIDEVLLNRKITTEAFTVFFSSTGFPEADLVLEKQEEESGGTWYLNKSNESRGWLCPALFLYYKIAPKQIFVKFILL